MAIGKGTRIVVDVEDLALKRDLYAVLATEGRSLKDWFSNAANEYLTRHSPDRAARGPDRSRASHTTGKKRSR